MITIRNLIHKTLAILFVLYCFYSYGLQPYFTWETFWEGRLGSVAGISFRTIIGFLILLVSIFNNTIEHRKCRKDNLMLALWCFITTGCGILISGANHFLSFEWIIFLVMSSFLLSSDKIKITSYKMFYNIFVFTLIIPIIIYVLVHIGIHVPYFEIQAFEQMKQNQWISYKIFPLASQWTSPYQEGYCALRLCGIYNESGVVGTYAALLLCIEEFQIKKNWKNIVLLIGGIFSFSLAFFFIVFIYFAIKAARLNIKYLLIIIGGGVAFFLFMNVHFQSEALTRLQARFVITSYGLQGNNRTSASYDALFNAFLSEGGAHVLFGYGHGEIEKLMEERLINGSSYKNLIYNYGILGFLNQIIWMLALPLVYKNRKYNYNSVLYVLSCVLVFTASLYQRPAMFALQYMLPLVGGVTAHLNHNENRREFRKSLCK